MIEHPARRLLEVEDWLAVTNLSAAVPRLSISVAALAVSLSMMVAIAVMIGSFRETVSTGSDRRCRPISSSVPARGTASSARSTLSPDVIDARAPRARMSRPSIGSGASSCPTATTASVSAAATSTSLLAHGSLLFKAPADAREAMRARDRPGRGGGVRELCASSITSTSGDERARCRRRTGRVPFRIAAVYYDYSSDRGVLVMDRPTFERHYGDAPPAGSRVYLQDGAGSRSGARAARSTRIGESHRVFINTNASLRTEVLRIFDSTFAITYALEIIAILVAILGVSGTLLTLILERERELTILRLVGTGRRQIRRMVVGEAVLIGAISQAVGLVVGLLLSLVLIYVINVQSFGWTIQFHLPAAYS